MKRIELFAKALNHAVEVSVGYPMSPTGMYRCEEYEYIDPEGKPQGDLSMFKTFVLFVCF